MTNLSCTPFKTGSKFERVLMAALKGSSQEKLELCFCEFKHDVAKFRSFDT